LSSATTAGWPRPTGPTPRGASFRYDKTIQANADGAHPKYPAVIAIWGRDRRDEAARFAELIAFLKANGVIADYSQVALLLHSVREEHSGPYLTALEAKGIPAFCPRARAYFEVPEVRDLVACFAVIFGWHGGGRGQLAGAVAELGAYADDAIIQLGRCFGAPHPLAEMLQRWTADIAGLKEGEALDLRPADYLYHLPRGAPADIERARVVGHQGAFLHKIPVIAHRGQAVTGRELQDEGSTLVAPKQEEPVGSLSGDGHPRRRQLG
jgi:hypothetical protein